MTLKPRKPGRPRMLAELVGRALDPVLAKQGFGESDVILHWNEIAGARLAAVSEPVRMQWPPRPPGRPAQAGPDPATLVVRIEGAFALELQHVAPLIVERVNARLGWRCVGRIAVRQGPVRRAPPRPRKTPIDPGAEKRARELAAGIEDEGLREALSRLGAAALSAPKTSGSLDAPHEKPRPEQPAPKRS